MKADPTIRTLLERATADVPVDVERALDGILRAQRRKRLRHLAAVATAASLMLVAVVVVWQQSPRNRRFDYGSEAPSGRLLIERRTDSGAELYTVDLASRVQTQITSREQGTPTAAQWSPDGASVAFTVEQLGGESYALVVARADGSNPVKIVEHPKAEGTLGPDFVAVAWSPDGSKLAYSGRTIGRGRTVTIVSADGSNPRVLDGLWISASWSRDGRYLLVCGWPYGAGRDGRFDLYRMRVDGTDLVRLTDDELTEHNASWSPDGSQIVFARSDQPGDKGNVDVYVMDADGSNVRRLTEGASLDGVPVWSPDGEWIAFTSDRDAVAGKRLASANEQSLAESSIYAMRRDGSDVRRLIDGTDMVTFPLSWTK